MSDLVIRQMSEITLPEELLKQIDIDQLIKKFQDAFKKLDDFKKVKSNYENRSVWTKFGDLLTFDSTMEDAQLTATETQAEFSKIVGQLMVLSVIQSQKLQEQQNQLLDQQKIISNLTKEIERHTSELKDRHDLLANQSVNIDELIYECIALKKQTVDRAEKILATAEECRGLEAKYSEALPRLDNLIEFFASYRASTRTTFRKLYAGLAVLFVGLVTAFGYIVLKM